MLLDVEYAYITYWILMMFLYFNAYAYHRVLHSFPTRRSSDLLLLSYPVMVNTVLLTLFIYSLKKPPTIIERFARLKYHDLSQTEIRYTRLVTICWCYFFLFNGSIALITCFMDNLAWWTLYNGGISRSEERRVGKECRSWLSPANVKKQHSYSTV